MRRSRRDDRFPLKPADVRASPELFDAAWERRLLAERPRFGAASGQKIGFLRLRRERGHGLRRKRADPDQVVDPACRDGFRKVHVWSPSGYGLRERGGLADRAL